MRTTVIFTAIFFLGGIAAAQDTLRKFEFGVTVASVNSFNTKYYFAPDRPSVEFLNAMFFRYTCKRMAFRAHAAYSENSYTYASPPEWSDGMSGDVANKDLRIGVGAQYALLKRRQWLYAFADVSYRNVFSTGHDYGGIRGVADNFSRSANGFDIFLGPGLRLKLLKNVFLSPEAGYLYSQKFINSTTTSMISGHTSRGRVMEMSVTTIIRAHLTVRF
jgi:hypothetical protein